MLCPSVTLSSQGICVCEGRATMSDTTSPACENLQLQELDIDEQWEKFARDGCPDWWLMAKYTSGWLTRTFPYVPFRERLNSVARLATPEQAAADTGSAVCSKSALEVEQPQALQQTAAEGTAATPSLASTQDAARTPVPPPSQQAVVVTTQGATSSQAAAPAASTGCYTLSSTAAIHPAPASQDAAASCGHSLKDFFSCRAPPCVSSSAADRPVDQHG